MKVDFGFITREAFGVAWRHKLLWIFGIFAGGVPWNMNLGGDSDSCGLGIEDSGVPELVGDLGSLWLIIVPVVLFLILFAITASVIADGALVDAFNRLVRGSGQWSFRSGFSAGLDHFWRVFGVGLVGFLVAVAFILLAVLFGVLAFNLSTPLGILYILIALPFAFAFIVGAITAFSLATRVTVIRRSRVGDSISEGWTLFKLYWKESLLMFFIYLGIMIGLGILALLVILMVGLPVIAAWETGGVGVAIAIVIGLLIAFPVLLAIGGFTSTAMHGLYTLFYFELVEPRERAEAARPSPPQPLTP